MLYFGTSVFLLCTYNRHRVFDYVQNVFGYVYLITMPLRMQGFGTDINVQTCKQTNDWYDTQFSKQIPHHLGGAT